MRKKALTIMLAAVLAMTMMFAGGCGGSEEASNGSAEVANDAKTLVYGSKDYTAINPALYEHGEINELIFEGMTRHDKDNKVVPALAEDWEYDADSMTYTFKLRDGLTFHDGEALTSEDVKFTLETILDEDNQSEIASNYTEIEKIECPDDLTVEIKLSSPNQAFPEYMTIGVLPEHLLKGEDIATCDFNREPVGAGPYKMTEWDEGQSITLEKFDGYYGDAPAIEKVIFKIVDDDDARAMQMESGDLDIAQVTPSAAKDLAEKDGLTVYDMKTADYRAIAYNFNSDFFGKHRELPKILAYAIDRETIVKSVLLGDGEVANSPLQAGDFYAEDLDYPSYDAAKCEELLKEAGWTKGDDGIYEKDGEKLAFTIYAMENDKVRVDMAKLCAKNLQDIGIDAKAEAKAELDWEKQDSCIIGWGSPFDPDDHTFKIFTSEAGDNYTYYSNKAVDETLAAARKESDVDKRKALYADFQQELIDDPAYTFIAYVDANYVANDNIKGITPETILGHHGVGIFYNIEDWTIE